MSAHPFLFQFSVSRLLSAILMTSLRDTSTTKVVSTDDISLITEFTAVSILSIRQGMGGWLPHYYIENKFLSFLSQSTHPSSDALLVFQKVALTKKEKIACMLYPPVFNEIIFKV